MKKTLFLLVAVCVLLSAPLAMAAERQMGPPKVLMIIREDVKVGKGAAHEKVETGYVRAFSKANWPAHYLAMTSVSGAPEAWFLVGYDSFASIEKERKETEKNAALSADLEKLDAQDAEMISGLRRVIALYRDDLSYRADTVNIAQYRYMEVITYRVRPGHDMEFDEAAKMIRSVYEMQKLDVPWAVFQVALGMPGPTFLVVVPMKSLTDVDAALGRRLTMLAAIGEEGLKKLQKMASDGYLNVEATIYAFNPKMSYVSKETAAADPEFWTPEPAAKMAAPAAAMKGGAKAAGPAGERFPAPPTPPTKPKR